MPHWSHEQAKIGKLVRVDEMENIIVARDENFILLLVFNQGFGLHFVVNGHLLAVIVMVVLLFVLV
jgi:hypothetical protein